MVTAAIERQYKMERGLTQSGESDIISQFWQEWLEHRDKLYSCCLKLMTTSAEDALSQAQIKAWEKVQEFGEKIRNLKAWLTQLTRNLCLDIIRESSRGAVGVENIELLGDKGVLFSVSSVLSPEMALEREEKSQQIRRAVASLRQRLRDTFVLHFYQGLNHREIAERQGISYDNVCKRISLARKELETMLRGYFQDEEDLATVMESARKKSPTPVAQVEKRKIQSDEDLAKETATVSAGKECVPVVVEAKLDLKDGTAEDLALVEEKMVEKETATVWAASACAAVAVDEKPFGESGVESPKDIVEQKTKEVFTKVLTGSPEPTPLASGERQLCSQLGWETATVSAVMKCVSVALGEKLELGGCKNINLISLKWPGWVEDSGTQPTKTNYLLRFLLKNAAVEGLAQICSQMKKVFAGWRDRHRGGGMRSVALRAIQNSKYVQYG